MNIDELNGRALDAKVAETLFKLRVQERRNTKSGELEFVYETGPTAALPEHLRQPQYLRVPEYTRSLAANLSVEAWLAEKGWQRIAPVHNTRPGPGVEVRVAFEHKDGRRIEVSGQFDEAICRAALKAVDA